MRKKSFITLILILCFALFSTPFSSFAATNNGKLSYGTSKKVGLSETKLKEIDTIVLQAINNGITPGAVVLISKDNKIIKESAYGYAEKYDMGNLLDKPTKMTKKTLFDLASVTKVMATTQGIMKLASENKLSIEDKVSDIIPAFAQNGKEDITIADLLSHTSGLTPWQPTYLHADTPEEVLDYINELPLEYETGTDRRYSDFSFMTLAFIIEEVTGQAFDEYLEQSIYTPLQMQDTMFNPNSKTKKRIAATSWGNPFEYKMIDDPNFGYYVEEDADSFTRWRDYTLRGEVNDGNSFYANQGVAGHAGLFSTAKDLAILGQAMLNNGTYGKVKLYDEETIDQFTSPYLFGQGLGWELNKSWYMGDLHSPRAFGHTGFTGTQIIVDPTYNLQIIILTNKQNNGPLASGSYASTGTLSKQIANKVYEAMQAY
ncbi:MULTISPECIES: serine hydrolase [unclassified Virgibacillus]|uniref:serine hydrolase n=1 Tax=unclassified Virgibacillus TaxID=2620237 RepID=UPI0024DE0AAA|nr:serine hydrolase [Virgibacillus sp. LDC-1]